MLGGHSRTLFSRELCISYAHKDGRECAEKLAKRLINLDFAFFSTPASLLAPDNAEC